MVMAMRYLWSTPSAAAWTCRWSRLNIGTAEKIALIMHKCDWLFVYKCNSRISYSCIGLFTNLVQSIWRLTNDIALTDPILEIRRWRCIGIFSGIVGGSRWQDRLCVTTCLVLSQITKHTRTHARTHTHTYARTRTERHLYHGQNLF